MTPPDPAPGPCSAGPLTNVPLILRESDLLVKITPPTSKSKASAN
jgi:hypothetical protein